MVKGAAEGIIRDGSAWPSSPFHYEPKDALKSKASFLRSQRLGAVIFAIKVAFLYFILTTPLNTDKRLQYTMLGKTFLLLLLEIVNN